MPGRGINGYTVKTDIDYLDPIKPLLFKKLKLYKNPKMDRAYFGERDYEYFKTTNVRPLAKRYSNREEQFSEFEDYSKSHSNIIFDLNNLILKSENKCTFGEEDLVGKYSKTGHLGNIKKLEKSTEYVIGNSTQTLNIVNLDKVAPTFNRKIIENLLVLSDAKVRARLELKPLNTKKILKNFKKIKANTDLFENYISNTDFNDKLTRYNGENIVWPNVKRRSVRSALRIKTPKRSYVILAGVKDMVSPELGNITAEEEKAIINAGRLIKSKAWVINKKLKLREIIRKN